MAHRVLLHMLIVIAACRSGLGQAAEELIVNGGFEGVEIATEKDGDTPGIWTGYMIRNSGGSFAMVPEGRRGLCVKYVKRGEGSHNFHLNQVFPVTPETNYELRVWMQADEHLRPVITVSNMKWKHLATAVVTPSAEWRETRLLFNSGANTLLRFEWFAGAEGRPFTGIAGTSRLDDVSITPLAGRTLCVATTVRAREAAKTGIPPRPIGVSENVFRSSDRYFPGRKLSQVQTLKLLGGKTIRGMEGNIGDFLIWSVPPYDRPALRLTAYHPQRGYMSQFYNADGTLQKPMEFDEYLETGKASGVETFFYIIGIDAIRADSAQWQSVIPDPLNTIAEAAQSQARYARARGVHVWFEIGNENDLQSVDEKLYLRPWTAKAYLEAVQRIGAAIKAGDPEAKVGINGGFRENREWLDVILPTVAEQIDFLVAHAYHPTGTGTIDRVNDAIEHASVPEVVKERWTICVTETSSYKAGSGEPMANDLAEAVRNFVRMGINLQTPRVSYMHFWTDRAGEASATTGKCAFAPEGGLLPVGKVLAIWNNALGDRMLRAFNDIQGIPVFVTRQGTDGTIRVFLVNQLNVPIRFEVTIEGVAGLPASVWTWSGTSEHDTAPAWKRAGSGNFAQGKYTVELPGFGIGMLALDPSPK